MKQPHALIGSDGVRAPHIIIRSHRNHKALTCIFNKFVRCSNQFFVSTCTILVLINGLVVIGETIDILPCRNISRNPNRFVIRISCHNIKFRRSKLIFVRSVRIFVSTRFHSYGIRIIKRFRVESGPSIRPFRGRQTFFCKHCIKLFVNAISLRHDSCKIVSSSYTLTYCIPLTRIINRHNRLGERKSRNLMINASIRSLHRKHPIQIVLYFSKQIGQISFFRNIPLERLEVVGIMFVQSEQRVSGYTRIDDILSIIAGIVPSLATVKHAIIPCRSMRTDSRIQVARTTLVDSRIHRIQIHGRSLIVEEFERRL